MNHSFANACTFLSLVGTCSKLAVAVVRLFDNSILQASSITREDYWISETNLSTKEHVVEREQTLSRGMYAAPGHARKVFAFRLTRSVDNHRVNHILLANGQLFSPVLSNFCRPNKTLNVSLKCRQRIIVYSGTNILMIKFNNCNCFINPNFILKYIIFSRIRLKICL